MKETNISFYQSLLNEEKRLLLEKDRVEDLLNYIQKIKTRYKETAFTNTLNPHFLEVNQNEDKNLIKPVSNDVKAKPYIIASHFVRGRPYNSNFTLHQKAIYALMDIKKGLVSDIAKRLTELDSSITPLKAKKICTHHLSRFYVYGLIGANKIGKKNEYYFK